VRIWDVTTAGQRVVLAGHRGAVYAVAVAPDGRWVASGGGDGTIRVWDTARWQAQALMRVDGQVFTCAWLDTDAIACGGSAGLYVFDFLGGTGLSQPLPADGQGLQTKMRPARMISGSVDGHMPGSGGGVAEVAGRGA